MDIILHQPQTAVEADLDAGTTTLTGVASFEVEFGDRNTVMVTFHDGDTIDYSGVGLLVSGGTLGTLE